MTTESEIRFCVSLVNMTAVLLSILVAATLSLSSAKEARCVFRGEGTMDMEGEIRLLDPEGGANIT